MPASQAARDRRIPLESSVSNLIMALPNSTRSPGKGNSCGLSVECGAVAHGHPIGETGAVLATAGTVSGAAWSRCASAAGKSPAIEALH